MEKNRITDARFFNSVISGMADILFKWDGGVFSAMGHNVGRELLDVIEKDLDIKAGSTIQVLGQLSRQLVESYRVADSINVTENTEKGCIDLEVGNCVLLPFAKREIERNPWFKRKPLCPIKNVIMRFLENKGENPEVWTFDLNGDRCHILIGLIGEVPMEKELKEAERKG